MTNRSNPDQFQLRLSPGLRDRIKAYADQHGRSMNTEIVRILEREFPEPWTIEDRVSSVLGMMAMLRDAGANEHIATLNDALEETVAGIASGRIQGVDDGIRQRIEERFDAWKLQKSEDDYLHHTGEMDDEELVSLDRGHGTSKF